MPGEREPDPIGNARSLFGPDGAVFEVLDDVRVHLGREGKGHR